MLEARLVETNDEQLKTQLRHIINKMEEEHLAEEGEHEEGHEVIEEEEYEDENEEDEDEEEEDVEEEDIMSISDFSNDKEFGQFKVSAMDFKKMGTEKTSNIFRTNQLKHFENQDIDFRQNLQYFKPSHNNSNASKGNH